LLCPEVKKWATLHSARPREWLTDFEPVFPNETIEIPGKKLSRAIIDELAEKSMPN
jgi:hypothetical protein